MEALQFLKYRISVPTRLLIFVLKKKKKKMQQSYFVTKILNVQTKSKVKHATAKLLQGPIAILRQAIIKQTQLQTT